MEGIEEEKHTVVVKWNTNTQCEQTQASTQKTCFSQRGGVGEWVVVFFVVVVLFPHTLWKFPYKTMLKRSEMSAVDCTGL